MIGAPELVGLEVVHDFEQLCGLRDEWRNLVHTQNGTTPFQTPEWLLTWWRHFGSGELRGFVFCQGDALVGVIPLFLHEWRGRRQLTLAGSGISDYLEPVMVPGYRDSVLAETAGRLCADPDWDICEWQDLSAETPLSGLASHRCLSVESSEDLLCSRIALRGSWEDFCQGRPHGLRRNLRRYAEKARAIAEPEFAVTRGEDAALLEELIRLHRKRWRQQGESGMIAANRSAAFLREVSAEFAGKDMLRFFTLRFQDRIAAIILAFAHQQTLFAYLSGFDPEYQEFGFGRLLLQHALRHAFEQGYRAWDFLRGDELYKFDWGAQSVRKTRLIIFRRNLATR